MKNNLMIQENKINYFATKIVTHAPNIKTIYLECRDGTGKAYTPVFRAGQFINVYFPETGTPEGKAYSISSAPHEDILAITVKAVGEFSNKLHQLKVGDRLTASMPYGYFYTETETSELVMIAGGISIAPFRSMILDSLQKKPNRKLALFHSSRTYDESIFRDEFAVLEKRFPNLKVFRYVTRDKVANVGIIHERLKIEDIIGTTDKAKLDIHTREFLICGSINFVGELWKGLRKAGVPEDVIYTESFFSH